MRLTNVHTFASRGSVTVLILSAGLITALWIRSFWLMDDVGIEYITHERPGATRMVRFHNITGSTKFSITITHDALGTADLAIQPERQNSPGFHWFANIGDDPRSNSYGRWWQEKDYFTFPGFGLSHHGWTDRRDVAQGWLVTTQPATTNTAYGYSIWFPHPVLILALLAWPFMRWRSNRRFQQRLRLGLCTQCGYDMRATPNRCPECGNEPAFQAKLAS